MFAIEDNADLHTAIIAEQNDLFRRAIICPRARLEMKRQGIEGRTDCTAAIAAEGPRFLLAAAGAVAKHDTFTTDVDPHGDHAFGTVTVQGKKIWWRIDLQGPDMVHASDRPHDPACTLRVLTIFLAHEH